MKITSEDYINRLLDASNRKIEFLKDMYELTLNQSNAINDGRMESLTEIMSFKQEKINEINKLDEQFEVYFRGLKRELNVQSLEEIESPNIRGIKELKACISQIFDLLREISEIENINNEKVKGVLEGYKNEIRKLNQGKKVTSLYYPRPIRTISHFIDQKK